jgi:putative oxidoreductase
MIATLNRYAPWMLGIFRIFIALVYMEHGTQKLFHFPPQGRFGGAGPRAAAQAAKSVADTASSALSSVADGAASAVSSVMQTISASSAAAPAVQGGPPPSMASLFLIAGILETFGGLALVLGLLTRPIAFIVAGEVAYIFWFMDVADSGSIFPASNGGELAVVFCFSFLYLVFAGSGAFALDNFLWRRKAA